LRRLFAFLEVKTRNRDISIAGGDIQLFEVT